MELYLTKDKTPDRNVSIFVNMNLYKWTGNNLKQNKESLFGNLSDTVVLHYDSSHQPYWPREAFATLEKKENSILPDKDIYLLTDDDRKLYTLTVDKEKIGVPRDTTVTTERYKPKKARTVTVPLILHNNSNDTLKFYSMTCSWDIFFGTNSSKITLPGWPCEDNAPEVVIVAPHKEYKKNLNLVYYSMIKRGYTYRISMSLLKMRDKSIKSWYYDPEEYVRYNKIWSNEITVR